MSRTTIHAGLAELRGAGFGPEMEGESAIANGRRGPIRAPGSGRKKLTDKDDSLLTDLDTLVEPTTRGDPMSALRWTCKSTRRLAQELKRRGHQVSQRTVCNLLGQMGYSLQSTRKLREGGQHQDRDGQFEHIARAVAELQATGDPVVSVDTKKKELIGDFKNGGKEWQPHGTPEPVRVHDFIDRKLGKVAPYGVYDLTMNTGWVSVGIDHDTAEFAVESMRRWWREMGEAAYPQATRLLITADHRMFCHITANWRGRPLTSREVVVNLIGNATTCEGREIKAALDERMYAAGVEVSNEEIAGLVVERDEFHGN